MPKGWIKGRVALLKKRALSLVVAVIRRSRLLPKSYPDRLGDDALLLRKQLDAQVVVFFADTIQGLYQLEPWYAPLRQLHQTHPVVIIGNDSRCIKRVRQTSGLPAYTVEKNATIDALVVGSPIRLVLYVNHNSGNFFMLRYPELVHVSVMHGDSDKVITISNQTKAYDFTFVAGQAAIDRLATYLPMFDAAERCIPIGRPQIKLAERAVPLAAPWRVLYAPTWEGGVPSAAYSSLEVMGRGIVEAITADPRFSLTYRPHPLTGVRLASFGAADQALRQMVQAAAVAYPAAGHQVSVGGNAMTALDKADLLISDVSSLAIDFLPTGRPLLVTIPPDPEVKTAATKLLEAVPRLDSQRASDLADLLAEHLTKDPAKTQRTEATAYYLGDVTPGAATAKFVAACGQMIQLADQNRAELAARTAGGSSA